MKKSVFTRIATFALTFMIPVSMLGISTEAFSIKASAQGISGKYITDDLPKVPVPDDIILPSVTVDQFFPKTKNSNLNTDVATGEHYKYLSDNAKKLYRAIVKAGRNVYEYGTDPASDGYAKAVVIDNNLTTSDSFWTQQEFQDAYEAVRYDNIDSLQTTLCSMHIRTLPMISGSGTVYSKLIYMLSTGSTYTNSWFGSATTQMRNRRTQLLADPSITAATTAAEKELAIHDLLLSINTYDSECYNSQTAYHIGHTAYGALIDGESVCDGYAMSMVYLLDGVNIDSLVISGTAKGGHAWNIVNHGIMWYELDATWDDQEISRTTYGDEFVDAIEHNYYNLTTAQISNYSFTISAGGYTSSGRSTRSRDGFSLDLPLAEGTGYSWSNRANWADVNDNGPEEDTDNSSGNSNSSGSGEGSGSDDSPGNNGTSGGGSSSSNDISGGSSTGSGESKTGDSSDNGETQSADSSKQTPSDADATAEVGDEIAVGSSGNYIVTGITDGVRTVIFKSPATNSAKNIVIPSTITGGDGNTYTVTAIDSGAFAKCKNLTSITIPSTVTSIGKNAFKKCAKLKKITIYANNLKSIKSGAFKNVSPKAKMTIFAGNKKTYNKVVKMVKKAGLKRGTFKYRKG